MPLVYASNVCNAVRMYFLSNHMCQKAIIKAVSSRSSLRGRIRESRWGPSVNMRDEERGSVEMGALDVSCGGEHGICKPVFTCCWKRRPPASPLHACESTAGIRWKQTNTVRSAIHVWIRVRPLCRSRMEIQSHRATPPASMTTRALQGFARNM
jgi:hypothetical protein